ncbi:hypothetical protein GCM10017557_24380 [Streptomyces aurantiacus]|uniref:Uncharacterized protein n=1 Tax=Streptomyces aurantiacus TaxID=47760 RepID=A0A7G1NXB7_9ACTN|nr:hypothetical protein GCM10017557_24380 [Streptomyces aurantiacus]
MRDRRQPGREHVEQVRLAGDLGRGALGRVLRAVPRLHHMGGAGGDGGQVRAQGAYVLGSDESRSVQEPPPYPSQLLLVFPPRLLAGRLRSEFEHGVVH